MAQEVITPSTVEPPLEDFLFSLGIDAFWDEVGAQVWQPRNASNGRGQEASKACIITFSGHAQRDPGPAGAAFAVYLQAEGQEGQEEQEGRRERVWMGKSNVS